MRRRRDKTPVGPTRLGPLTSDVSLIAAREVRERFRGRVLRVGTLLILAVVAAAIVIPVLDRSVATPQQLGVLGPLSALQRAAVESTAKSLDLGFTLHHEQGDGVAREGLTSGRLDVVVVNGRLLLVNAAIAPLDTSGSAQFVRALSRNLGIANAISAAGLSAAQASILATARPLDVATIEPGAPAGAVHAESLIGLILLFLMLTQYTTWILVGVMEEKSSRVAEVLLAAVRPVRLLTGKVLGIGIVAFGQAALIVGFAAVLATAVGSSLLHGTAPTVLAATLVWLVLGYGFYCWVYAAAGSTVERQDQAQSLAFPLSLPIVFGYLMAIIATSQGSASTLFKVLAYLPPTAPFAMPVLVGFGEVTWWGFVASALLSVACTVLVARAATSIYRRAILRTGGRVPLRDLLTSARDT